MVLDFSEVFIDFWRYTHVYLYTSTIYSLHIVYLQKSMKTTEKSNTMQKSNENSGTINEHQ
jgi:hypothetical protein